MKSVLVVRQVEHEGLGALADVFATAGIEWHYADMFASPAARFDPGEHRGLVLLGGPMNVDETERYPFLVDERRWVEGALAAESPVLGICLGAQVMARTLGATVQPRPLKEIGWYTVDLTPAAADDRLFRHLETQPTVFQWHGDGFELPQGATALASSPLCPVQAFRYGRNAYALQFHLEVTGEILRRWLKEPGNCTELADAPYINPVEIRRRVPQELPRMLQIGRQVFDEFAAMCREREGKLDRVDL